MWQHWNFNLVWYSYILKSRAKKWYVSEWFLIFKNWLIIGLGTHFNSVFLKKIPTLILEIIIVTNESCVSYFIFLFKNIHYQNNTKWPQTSQSGIY